jgi:uncharacterized Zn finger protein (UPF0148 family)
MCEEFEMPTPCCSCKEIFELHDGVESVKWNRGTTICKKCGDEEEKEVEKEDRIEELKELIDAAKSEIQDYRNELIELGQDVPTIIWTPLY